MKPGEEFHEYWIRAFNKTITYPEPVDGRSGKWLVFLPKGNLLDDMWAKVAQSIREGKLGRAAKASTMKPNSHAVSSTDGVICVYTYSLDDLEDARRVRQELRELGITWRIPYKLDRDIGRYSNESEVGLSKLYE